MFRRSSLENIFASLICFNVNSTLGTGCCFTGACLHRSANYRPFLDRYKTDELAGPWCMFFNFFYDELVFKFLKLEPHSARKAMIRILKCSPLYVNKAINEHLWPVNPTFYLNLGKVGITNAVHLYVIFCNITFFLALWLTSIDCGSLLEPSHHGGFNQ